MKRSRRPEYNKKRTHSNSDSKRSLPSSNKGSAKTSDSIDRLKDFEITESQEKKYRHRQVPPKKKSGCFNFKIPLAIVVIVLVFKILMAIDGATRSSKTAKDDPFMQEIMRNEKKPRRNVVKVNAPDFMVGKNKPLREVIQLEKASTFPIIPYVNVQLYKGYHIYDATAFPNTPILAKFSKYYFFCDRVEKSPNESLTNQWATLRNELTRKVDGSKFAFDDYKNYSLKGMTVEEKEFTIFSGETELQGVATLVEFENMRYFFHFISKEKEGKYYNATYLRKYMNYYLKFR